MKLFKKIRRFIRGADREMKLNDVYTKPLKDVVEELNLTDMKVHTDDDGEVRSIELKYEPNNRFTKGARS